MGSHQTKDTTGYRAHRGNGNSDVDLSHYLAVISRTPLLTRDQELMYAKQAKSGDNQARCRMILGNLRLVVSIAKKYLYYGLPLSDLIEEGNIGLMKAADRYNPEIGTKFSTYATWWIRQAVTRSLSNGSRTMRIPVYVTDTLTGISRDVDELRQKTFSEPSLWRIIEHSAGKRGLSEKRVEKLLAVCREGVSLDDAVENNATPSHDFRWFDHNAISALEGVEASDSVDRLLGKLSDREANILRHRFGITDGTAHTLEETGASFHLTRERIRQIEKDAFRKLRAITTSDRDSYR